MLEMHSEEVTAKDLGTASMCNKFWQTWIESFSDAVLK